MSFAGFPRMVSPPIYQFTFPYHPEMESWGWHRASDLYEAINNLLVGPGLPPISIGEIESRFEHLSPRLWKILDPHQEAVPYTVIVPDCRGDHCICKKENPHWLEKAIKVNGYLPAKVGAAIIHAIKHPVQDRLNPKRLLVS